MYLISIPGDGYEDCIVLEQEAAFGGHLVQPCDMNAVETMMTPAGLCMLFKPCPVAAQMRIIQAGRLLMAKPIGTTTLVMCVDDNSDMLLMMQMLIDIEPGMQSVGYLSSSANIIGYIERFPAPPNVLVLDATMPGEDPLAMIKKLSARFPALKTIIYSGNDDAVFVALAKKSGAWGCVSKREEPEVIIRAVEAVAAGNVWFPN